MAKKASVTETIATPTPTRRAATPVRLISERLYEELAIVGSVPVIPARNIPIPLTLTMPWTCRKSIARGRRREPCWITTPSLIVLSPSTRVRMANEGRSAQNSVLGARSKRKSGTSGMPNQPAPAIRSPSSTPNAAATAHPARMLMNGATRRQRPLARSVAITETSRVMPAITGPAATGASAGRSWTASKAMGNTLTAISIVTVPETVGVTIRRSVGSHQASATWITLHTTSRLANVSGPAREIVATMIAMNIAAGQANTM